jgi:hypothetical protein
LPQKESTISCRHEQHHPTLYSQIVEDDPNQQQGFTAEAKFPAEEIKRLGFVFLIYQVVADHVVVDMHRGDYAALTTQIHQPVKEGRQR